MTFGDSGARQKFLLGISDKTERRIKTLAVLKTTFKVVSGKIPTSCGRQFHQPADWQEQSCEIYSDRWVPAIVFLNDVPLPGSLCQSSTGREEGTKTGGNRSHCCCTTEEGEKSTFQEISNFLPTASRLEQACRPCTWLAGRGSLSSAALGHGSKKMDKRGEKGYARVMQTKRTKIGRKGREGRMGFLVFPLKIEEKRRITLRVKLKEGYRLGVTEGSRVCRAVWGWGDSRWPRDKCDATGPSHSWLPGKSDRAPGPRPPVTDWTKTTAAGREFGILTGSKLQRSSSDVTRKTDIERICLLAYVCVCAAVDRFSKWHWPVEGRVHKAPCLLRVSRGFYSGPGQTRINPTGFVLRWRVGTICCDIKHMRTFFLWEFSLSLPPSLSHSRFLLSSFAVQNKLRPCQVS